MRVTKRQRTLNELSVILHQLEKVSGYVKLSEKDDWWYASEETRSQYWSHSKIETVLRKAKKMLLEAKAARYDAIAPYYDQLTIDFENQVSAVMRESLNSETAEEELPW